MTYRTLMVHVDLEQCSEAALRVTGELANRFKSEVIGVTSGLPSTSGDGMVALNEPEARDRHLNQAIARSESHFRAALAEISPLEWRAGTALPADFLAAESRAADLVVVGRPENFTALGPYQPLSIGDAIMKAGRPVLVVPPRHTSTLLNRILIAWKDTAESRTAVSAALPLLKKAAEIAIVEIVSDEEETEAAGYRVADVARWLQRHNVAALPRVELSAGADGSQLDAIASESRIDMIVAGAYGHARLREWIFGGVTHHLLQRGSMCTFFAH